MKLAVQTADIVGMQETGGSLATALALDLGWFAFQGPGSVALLSRFPISELFPPATGDAGLGARIRVASSPVRDVIVWVCHLTAFPYGPYSACLDGLPTSQVLNDETHSGRVHEISSILHDMAPLIAGADSIPVFLMGDFNTPSHLDWTPAASALHCGYTLDWPVTRRVADAGLVDSYRRLHPDPVADPGNTWSPVFKTFTYPDGTPEPQDRIDMIHYAGHATPVASTVFVIEPISQFPAVAGNEWPSDHAAVISTFEVALGGGENLPLPTLDLDDRSYASGEPIVATFAHAPGNPTDWIGLYREADTPGAPSIQAAAWFYTNNSQVAQGQSGPESGQVIFDDGSGPTWPLPGGNYRAFFLCCDGYTVLAAPVSFHVTGPGGGEPLPSTLTIDKTTYASGETIVATFANGPGNATDWIGIYALAHTPGVEPSTTWFYTNNRQRVSGETGPMDGQVIFGNRSAPVWPLPPGDYKILLLCCDGYSTLAGPLLFTVVP